MASTCSCAGARRTWRQWKYWSRNRGSATYHLHAPRRPICAAAEGRVLFSESPPLSGDKPPTDIEKQFSAMRCMERRMLLILLGGFIPQSEFRENNRICKSEYE